MHPLFRKFRRGLALASFLILASSLLGQAPTAPPTTKKTPTVPAAPQRDPTSVASKVNGQPIFEVAVQRGLDRIPPAKREEARPELLNFLVDNLLIDQYLQQAKVDVPAKSVDDQVTKMKAELAKQKQEFSKLLGELKLTEKELRRHIAADLRWEKYVTTQATDAALTKLFQGNQEMFNGAMCRARHILLPAAKTDKAAQETQQELLGLKQQIEAEVAKNLAALPAESDPAKKAKARASALEQSFAKVAKKMSVCPSKAQGGDVGWFQRAGFMVEPFAKTAFSLQPYQLSPVVKTQFGYHLIVVTAKQPGKTVKFETVKAEVREVFAERLHDSLAAQLRRTAKIEITP